MKNYFQVINELKLKLQYIVSEVILDTRIMNYLVKL